MARPLRIEYEGAVYHVMARGNDRGKIFFSKKDYLRFKKYLFDAREKYSFILHSYTLMTSHYHLIIETPEGNLSKIMHYLNSAYSTYLNIRKQRSGHLFQGRYKSILIDSDSYLLELSRYIHLNPVRAQMVEHPEDYPHSSYASFIGAGDGLTEPSFVLSMFSAETSISKHKYKVFVESALGVTLESPLENVYGGVILGRPTFIKNTLGRIEEDLVARDETAHKKALRFQLRIDDVLSVVCEHYGVSRGIATTSDRNDLRKLNIYLMKKYTAASNRDIGEALGQMRVSAVSKAYQRMGSDVEKNLSLKQEIELLVEKMSRVEG